MNDNKFVKNTSDAKFDSEVLGATALQVVDFWAEWCGPCQTLSPALESLAQEFNGQIEVQKLDVDHNAETAIRYGVRGIPTLLIIKSGQVIDRMIGAVPKEVLKNNIQKHLIQN